MKSCMQLSPLIRLFIVLAAIQGFAIPSLKVQMRTEGDGGAATEATLIAPEGVAVDAQGNLFVAERGAHRVRRVEAKTGIISTYAGTGEAGFGGDGGPAAQALLDTPSDVGNGCRWGSNSAPSGALSLNVSERHLL